MYYLKFLLLILLLFFSVGFVSAENSTNIFFGENANHLTSDESIVINDSNFNSYFDDEGYIINEDIKENSTVYLGDISNRTMLLDIPLVLTSYNSSSVLYNTSIRISEDASGSIIKNLIFNFSLDETPSTPIYIDSSSDNVIENNLIMMDYDDLSYYNVCGIYITGESLNNRVSFNRIAISSKSNTKHYVYAIQVSAAPMGIFTSSYNPENNVISANVIDIESNHYAAGIYLSSTINSTVNYNNIVLNADSVAYGVVGEYNPLSSMTLPSHDINIHNNVITATSSMVYLIEIYDSYAINITSNTLTGVGNATLGISGYKTYNNILDNNTLFVNSSDTSLVKDNFDVMGSNHGGIYYLKDSYNINITNNRILSYYEIGGDYSITCSDTCSNISIFDNKLTSNNNSYHGDDSIQAEGYIFNNTYFSIDYVTYANYTLITIYVNNSYYGNGSKDNPFNSINDALMHLKNLNLKNKSANYKGIIYVGEGIYTGYNQNLRLYISDLNVELIGVYNKTIIDASNSHWFFEISQNSQVKITNLTFTNSILRKANYGLITNYGQLSVNNCIFYNFKVVDTSAIIYNAGILKLSNNWMNLSSNSGDYIYNGGRIENPYLNFLVDSFDENERVLELYSNYVVLNAYIHDDSGNPISGGYIDFFVESKSIPELIYVMDGTATLKMIISSFNNTIRVSGSYSNSYGNTIVNGGIIINEALSGDFGFYVDNTVNNTGDGSKNNPFPSVDYVLTLLKNVLIDDYDELSIYLSNGNYAKLDISNITTPIKIIGDENTNIIVDSKFTSNTALYLCNLKFNKVTVNSEYGNLFVENCVFTNALVNAIHSKHGNLTVSDCIFINNGEADFPSNRIRYPIGDMNIFNLGGAIKNEYGNLIISNSQFTGNNAVFGGAVYNNQGNLYIFDSVFNDNKAFSNFNTLAPESLGGAVYQYLGEEVIVSNTTFEGNLANGHGGAFYSSGSRPRALRLSEVTTEYVPFWMEEYVGLKNSPQKIYFVNSNFVNNMAPNGGGAVYITDNLLTQYISCNFDNNVAYSHDWFNILGVTRTWTDSYNDYSQLIAAVASTKTDNMGGAISDDNLVILDSTFRANTANSGGSIITPSIAVTVNDLSALSRDNIGVSFYSRGFESQTIYVADSSLLTAEDSVYLGISGWTGNYEGQSISRNIQNNPESYNHGGLPSNMNGNGNGGGNSRVDFSHNGGGNTGGNSGGNSNPGNSQGRLSMGDIYNMLGDLSGNTIVKNNGNIDISDLLNRLNAIYDGTYYDEMDELDDGNNPINYDEMDELDDGDDVINSDDSIDVDSNDTHQQSNDDIKVNGTTNNYDSSGGQSDSGGDAVSVGESSHDLTGSISNDNPDASDNSDVSANGEASNNQDSSGFSGSSSPSSQSSESLKASEISKKIDEPQDIVKSNISMWAVVFVILILLIIGYYRKRDDY